MTLLGGLAGLLSWGLVLALAMVLPYQEQAWVPDLISAGIFGAILGALSVGFSDHWSANRVLIRWIIVGMLVGILAAGSAVLIQIPITERLMVELPVLTRLIAWMLAGSLTGLGLGLVWIGANRLRSAHAFAGGLLGGAAGGYLFAGLGGHYPDLALAGGYMLTGIGICFGMALAPVLVRDGALQFVSSGDPRAQAKYGRTHREWEFEDGDTMVIGSHDRGVRQQQEIYIPDAAIAPQHATLFSRGGRFYLARHPDAAGSAGMARWVLRIRGKTITKSRELHDSDDILIGKTALRFRARSSTRRK